MEAAKAGSGGMSKRPGVGTWKFWWGVRTEGGGTPERRVSVSAGAVHLWGLFDAKGCNAILTSRKRRLYKDVLVLRSKEDGEIPIGYGQKYPALTAKPV